MMTRLITAIISGLALGVATGANAATLYVPGDYATIQGAINAADGDDTVLVSDGVYTGPGNYDLTIPDTTLVIASVNGPKVTTIDCEGVDLLDHRAFDLGHGSISSDRDFSLTLRGFTVQNGIAATTGGAITGDLWHLIIDSCIFVSNRADIGGAIYCESCKVEISNSQFRYNLAIGEGGAFYGPDSGTVSNTRFDFNQAETGGAAADFQNLVFRGCVFHQNQAQFGSALRPLPGDSVFFSAESVIFSRNLGDAAIFMAYGSADFSHCTFVNNAGGLALTAAGPTLTDCLLADNSGKPVVCYDPMPGRASSPWLTYSCMSDSGLDFTGCASSFYTMPNNLIADPMFCYLTTDDYRLQDESPCVGTASDGGNIGATGPGCIATDVDDDANSDPTNPYAFALEQNYPNPFNPSTSIRYTLPRAGHVRLIVYDLLGRQIRTLLDSPQSPGMHTAVWDGLTASGSPAASGVYFYRLTTPTQTDSKKMLLLK